jgi:transmembrane E3 ubiquitin-protein ligase
MPTWNWRDVFILICTIFVFLFYLQNQWFSTSTISPSHQGISGSQTSVGNESPSEFLMDETTEGRLRTRRTHLMFLGMAVLFQLFSTRRQMNVTRTALARDKISYWTFYILATADGLTCVILCCTATLIDSLSTALAAVGFLAFLNYALLDLEFLKAISATQEQDSRTPQQNQTAENGVTDGMVQDFSSSTLPVTHLGIPRPSMTSASPIIFEGIGSDGELLEQSPLEANVATINMFSTVILFMVTLWTLSWQRSQRMMVFDLATFGYFSFWMPQIYRNAFRNCHKALEWKFIIGQSIIRLIPLGYVYGYRHNVFLIPPNLPKLTLFIMWVFVQVIALAMQEIFRPRLFIPSAWVPPVWDYHPIIREDDELINSILGNHSTQSSFPNATTRSQLVLDCPICLETLEVPVNPEGSRLSNLLRNKSFAVTPCRRPHVFHTNCLESAMKFRLKCPMCREPLPPL